MILRSTDYRNTVEYFYREENADWHKNIHKKGGSVEENIQDTLDTITPGSIMYEIWEDGGLAAFFVKYKDRSVEAMEGFHIEKSFRNKAFIAHFWEEVKNYFEGEILIGLCVQNTPAIEHCKRQGFEVKAKDEINGKKFVVLVHKNEQIHLKQ